MAADVDRNPRFFVAVRVGTGFHSSSNEKAIRRACLAAAAARRKDDGTCLDAVSAAIQVLEIEVQNLAEEGHVECDASSMDDCSGAYGAVGAVPDQV